jgi:hypothetical protein
MNKHFENERELQAIVRDFENCTTPAADFHHRSHLVVATWYLNEASVPVALQTMRESILNFLDHYGIERKYNETITLFWLLIVDRCVSRMTLRLSLLERTNAVIDELSEPRLMFEYYSEKLLLSERAMSEWVEPDLKSLS